MNFNGTVQRVNANDFRGKKLWSFTLKGTQGFFNTGDKALSLVEGQQVEFEAQNAKRQGNFDVDFNTIKVVQGSTNSVPSTGSTPVTQRDGGAVRSAAIMSKDDYWRRREERDIDTQKRIELQSCRNSAIALAAVAFQGFEGPSDTIEKYVDTTTQYFLEQNMGAEVAEAPAQPAADKEWK